MPSRQKLSRKPRAHKKTRRYFQIAQQQPKDLFQLGTTSHFCAIDVNSLSKTRRAFYEVANKRSLSATETNSSNQSELETPIQFMPEIQDFEKFCICNKPYQEGELMFKCEGFCGDWYHPKCVQMSYAEMERKKNSKQRWYCTACRNRAFEVMEFCATFQKDIKRKKNSFL